MTKFRATASNGAGLTFSFTFLHPNWNGIQAAADARLAELVAADPLHQANGPWTAGAFDRAA